MALARMTSKGQVTIPVEVRRRLGVEAGDSLLFEPLDEGEVRLRVVKRRHLADLFGSLPSELPFPGKAAIREAAGESLGAGEAKEPHRP